MNRWNIPAALEAEILARDRACIYCGQDFSLPALTRGTKPSWEHIINDERIVTRENIARCCMSCNSSKGAKELEKWLESKYCKRKQIHRQSVTQIVRTALQVQESIQVPSHASA
jgi:hypothetical protein